MQLICKVCGKQWEAEQEPARCPDRKGCGSRHWKTGTVQESVQGAVQTTVQASTVQVPAVQLSTSGQTNAGPWNGQATSGYRQCRQCGMEFTSDTKQTAMQKHVDHLERAHMETGWGNAYAIIQANKKKHDNQSANSNS